MRVFRTWKRDGTRNELPGEVAVECLCKSALDAGLRVQGAGPIRDRLARGEAVETEHAYYVNALAAGAAAKVLAALGTVRPPAPGLPARADGLLPP